MANRRSAMFEWLRRILDREPLRLAEEEIHIEVEESSGVRTYACGHPGPEEYQVRFGGRLHDMSELNVCENCAKQHVQESAVLCAICSDLILPGHNVAVYDRRQARQTRDIFSLDQGRHVLGCARHVGQGEAVIKPYGIWNGQGVDPLQIV